MGGTGGGTYGGAGGAAGGNPGAGSRSGDGGGGGSHASVTSTFINTAPLTGGAGGAGGVENTPGLYDGGGGGGGGGGYAAVVTGSGPATNSAALTGGMGGNAGLGVNTSGSGAGGGDGGIGVQLIASGVSFTNGGSASIVGGMGGAGAPAVSGSFGTPGTGGAGVQFVASGATLVNGSGASITGGAGGRGSLGFGTGTASSGGIGVEFLGSGTLTNSGSISGGTGGSNSGASAAAGGPGGAGVQLLLGGTVTNNPGGNIAGGARGPVSLQTPTPSSVAGGPGIQASFATITNAGTITGGAGGSNQYTLTGAGGPAIAGLSLNVINAGVLQGGQGGSATNAVTFTGGINILQVQPGSSISGSVQAFSTADVLQLGGSGSGTFDVGLIGSNPGGQYLGFGGFFKVGSGTWTLTGTPQQATPWTINAGTLAISSDSSLGAANETLLINSGTLQALASLSSTRPIILGGSGGTLDTNGYTVLLGGNIVGSGILTKQGLGTLTLTGNNSLAGAVVSAGTLQGNAASLPASIVNNGTVAFSQSTAGTYAGSVSGAGTVTVSGGGVLTMTGRSTYTGATTVVGTTLVVNGNLASSVTSDPGSTIAGNGTVGTLVANGSTVRPGNSIGTLAVTGVFSQVGATYVVDVNSQGQSDRITAGGLAQLIGGTVQVQATQGTYAKSTTYTIVSSVGNLGGTFSNVVHNFAFLTPTLSYDNNNAYLTLALTGAAPFSAGAATPNQRAAGSGLDGIHANASGDMATVIGALTGLDVAQGQQALDALSGQPWANMATMNVAGAAMFMNAVGQQMAVARGAGLTGTRQALAQACDVAVCEAESRFSVWGSLLGGAGSVAGNGGASTVTYNQGGGAVGIDYRIDPRFVVGLGVGYGSGSMWVDNFSGKGWTSTVSAAAYASFAPMGASGFYADALAGYGYAGNQMQRQITIPNLPPRTASGSAGANQFLGQAEIGWQFPVLPAARASVTPFARFQVVSSTQGAFNEWGASSISLDVARQTTNSARSTLGFDLAGALPIGRQRALDIALRLGWMHEYAYVGRPITAAFAGSPSAAFTVYGASTPTDYAVIGLSAGAKVADATQAYLRYDGQLASGANNHTLTAGLRMSW